MRQMLYANALVEGLRHAMESDERVVVVSGHLLGLGPYRKLMEPLEHDFHDRFFEPPNSEAALAGLGAGVVTGLMSVSKHEKADAECENKICPADGKGPGLVEDFRSMRTLSTVFYGVGAAGVAAGVVFWLLAPSDQDPSQAAIAPWVGSQTLGVRGAF